MSLVRRSRRISPAILRDDGLLGTYGRDITVADAEMLGRAFGTLVMRSGVGEVAVCFDGRDSSPDLTTALTTGLTRTGATVLRIGRGPLPFVRFAIERLGVTAAVMVTGSDEPPEFNGLRLFIDAAPMTASQVARLADSATSGRFASGRGEVRDTPVFEPYLRAALEDAAEAWEKFPKLAWDAGNGATGKVVSMLGWRLSGRHTALHETIDGSFPARQPWRSLECSLAPLREVVESGGCDAGIAFDAAGETAIVVDERGRTIPPAALSAILAGADTHDPLRRFIRLVGRMTAANKPLSELVRTFRPPGNPPNRPQRKAAVGE